MNFIEKIKKIVICRCFMIHDWEMIDCWYYKAEAPIYVCKLCGKEEIRMEVNN